MDLLRVFPSALVETNIDLVLATLRDSLLLINQASRRERSSYLCSLFRKNSQSTSYRLRNTSTDLRLPKKVQKTARNAFRLGV